jgi:hypothetical protein
VRWAGHVPYTGEMRSILKYVLREHQENRKMGDISIKGRVKLKSTLNKYGARVSIGLIWLGIGSSDEPL